MTNPALFGWDIVDQVVGPVGVGTDRAGRASKCVEGGSQGVSEGQSLLGEVGRSGEK